VTKFRGGKPAAFTMQFDDSMESQAAIAVPQMNARGLVGTIFDRGCMLLDRLGRCLAHSGGAADGENGDEGGAQAEDRRHQSRAGEDRARHGEDRVAGGDARQVRDILHHNLLDLLTMAQLVVALLTGSAPVVE
jgi:hypothetical protein